MVGSGGGHWPWVLFWAHLGVGLPITMQHTLLKKKKCLFSHQNVNHASEEENVNPASEVETSITKKSENAIIIVLLASSRDV